MEYALVAFVLLVGPLALWLGTDSRADDRRGWWPGEAGHRATR